MYSSPHASLLISLAHNDSSMTFVVFYWGLVLAIRSVLDFGDASLRLIVGPIIVIIVVIIGCLKNIAK